MMSDEGVMRECRWAREEGAGPHLACMIDAVRIYYLSYVRILRIYYPRRPPKTLVLSLRSLCCDYLGFESFLDPHPDSEIISLAYVARLSRLWMGV